MLESLSSSVCKIWEKRQLHINTDFAVTWWMLWVITHISKNAKYHSNCDHRNQVKNVIKALFNGSSEDEMTVTLDMFWIDYTDFDKKIASFDADGFIWKSNLSEMVTVICGIKNINLLAPRFLVLFHVESHQSFLVLMY